MIISRVYGFPGDEPDKRKTFSFHQKVLRAIEVSLEEYRGSMGHDSYFLCFPDF